YKDKVRREADALREALGRGSPPSARTLPRLDRTPGATTCAPRRDSLLPNLAAHRTCARMPRAPSGSPLPGCSKCRGYTPQLHSHAETMTALFPETESLRRGARQDSKKVQATGPIRCRQDLRPGRL